jgi:lysophospholipase L1-like esterase
MRYLSALVLFVTVPAIADEKPQRFAKEIEAFEKQEQDKAIPPGSIIVIGSSSVRMWKLDKSFPGLDIVNRGFGGSQLSDSVQYAPRLLLKQKPRTIVLYAGDNDLAANRTPEQVTSDFKEFVAVVRKDLPATKIVFISIKPSPKRVALMDKARAANTMIAAMCKGDDRLIFLDVFEPMLNADEKPRGELFGSDGLHMNEKGYELWTSLLKPHLK